MLKNKNLLVDKNCPMCVFYGETFTRSGLISEQTVNPYQIIEKEKAKNINMDRAKSEIALYDLESKKTVYGIDAMIEIVSHNNFFFKALLKTKLIYWSLEKLYKFISYNRKIIFPTKHKNGERSCSPAFNFNYRLFYILTSTLVVGLILSSFVGLISSRVMINHHWSWEFIIGFGQILWQIPLILYLNKNKLIDYLGNMCTVSLIGSLALLPLVIINKVTELSLYLNLVYFGIVVVFMLYDHIRRCKILELPHLVSASWVIYRVFILSIILILTTF